MKVESPVRTSSDHVEPLLTTALTELQLAPGRYTVQGHIRMPVDGKVQSFRYRARVQVPSKKKNGSSDNGAVTEAILQTLVKIRDEIRANARGARMDTRAVAREILRHLENKQETLPTDSPEAEVAQQIRKIQLDDIVSMVDELLKRQS